MPQTIEQGDIFGRIGRSLGQGFGEGASSQVDRNALQKGVEKIANNKDLSEVERYGQLLRLPGGAEHANVLIPAIQRSRGIDALKNSPVTENISPVSQPTSNPQTQPSLSPQTTSSNLLTAPEEITRFKQNILQPPTQRDIDQLASTKIARGEANDIAEARQLASSELNQNFTSQENATNKFTNDLNGRVALGLQRAGLGGDSFQDVAGELQKRLVDEGNYLRGVKGYTSERASEYIDKIMTDIAKTANATRTAGERPYSESDLKVQDFKRNKKEFEKYGFGELYNDMVTDAAGITDLETAAILDPLKNPGLEKSLESAGKRKFKLGIPSHGVMTGKSIGIRKIGDDQIDNIISHIKPEDNILSTEHALRDYGIDLSDFKRRLNDTAYERLTDRQKRELGKSVSNSFLGDILFRAFRGKR